MTCRGLTTNYQSQRIDVPSSMAQLWVTPPAIICHCNDGGISITDQQHPSHPFLLSTEIDGPSRRSIRLLADQWPLITEEGR